MTVGQLIETSEEDLLSLRNFSRKSYDELRERLDELRIFPASKPWGLRDELWKPSDFKYERPRLLDDLL
jgi:DNA-directed RNA polymerase alpha subunit